MPIKYNELLSHKKIGIRIISLTATYWFPFLVILALSHYILPEGLLRGKTTGGSIEFSGNLLVGGVQIFVYNLISMLAIIVGSIFAKRKNENTSYFSLGVYALFLMCVINGMILGTNSFGIPIENVSFAEKVIGLLNVMRIPLFGK